MLRGEAAKRYARGGGRHVCALLYSWLRLPVYLVFLFRACHYVLTSVWMFVCQVVGEGVRRGGWQRQLESQEAADAEAPLLLSLKAE